MALTRDQVVGAMKLLRAQKHADPEGAVLALFRQEHPGPGEAEKLMTDLESYEEWGKVVKPKKGGADGK